MRMKQKLAAEAIGTFWLVFAGCGSALLAAGYPALGVGFLGIGLAFGLALLTAAYAFGHISGAHFNPAVTVGLAAARRFPRSEVLPYMAAQLAGALVAALGLYLIASGKPGFSLDQGFAANGYGAQSPGGYSLFACFLTEFILTGAFVMIILGTTGREAARGFAPLAIGLTLTAIHLVSLPVTSTSVNPARSIALALFAGGPAVMQLWLFIVAPILGATAGALLYRYFSAGRIGLAPAEDQPLRRASGG